MGKISELYEVERKDIEKTASTKLTVILLPSISPNNPTGFSSYQHDFHS